MGKIKTLVFSGGEIHDYKGCGQAAMEALSEREEFDLTYIENDLDALIAPKLDPYDLVVFFYTVGTIGEEQKNGLLNYVSSGKGYAGFHSASGSFDDCPEYLAMVGGHFLTHPAYRQYQVSIVDPEHPITKDMHEFFVTDEQYIMDYDPRIHILASSLWKGKIMPVAWTKHWGKGRVFYLALGHNIESAKDPNFKVLLQRGALWAGTPTG
jgi:type 1 glutamine amidotransferase